MYPKGARAPESEPRAAVLARSAAMSLSGPEATLARVRVVLVGTSHPGNVGAAARAMKTMGLQDLRLVAPESFPNAQATAMASGADDLLARALVHERLAQAVEGCGLVVGTTARERAIPWPALEVEPCAARLLEAADGGGAAVVFGRERTGLTNEELELCHAVLSIPTAAAYRSLNLAQAVQVVSYELRRTALRLAPGPVAEPVRDAPLATAEELERLYAHLETVMTEVGFYDPAKPRRLMRRLRRLFNRAALDSNEMNILRGFLAAVQANLGTGGARPPDADGTQRGGPP